jgi:hypothetical protein
VSRKATIATAFVSNFGDGSQQMTLAVQALGRNGRANTLKSAGLWPVFSGSYNRRHETDELIAALNEEIARLEEARRLLSRQKQRGRPNNYKAGTHTEHRNPEADGGSAAQEMGG